MSVIPGSFDFKPHRTGTTSSELNIQVTKNQDKVPIPLTGYIIEAVFTGPSKQTLSTANGGIVITNAANGEFKMTEQMITWQKGLYRFEFFFQTPQGKRNIYIIGQRLIT